MAEFGVSRQPELGGWTADVGPAAGVGGRVLRSSVAFHGERARRILRGAEGPLS